MCQRIKKGGRNFSWTQTEIWESFKWRCFRNSNFYQQDEYSRCCPGIKDFVSVTKDSVTTKHQKRLLLLNIKQLFLEFKEEYPTVKIGFSKFRELRLECVKTVNHGGMHSVCVCQYHQNVKLLVSVIPGNFEYKDILSKAVCNISLKKCMLHLCWLPRQNKPEVF